MQKKNNLLGRTLLLWIERSEPIKYTCTEVLLKKSILLLYISINGFKVYRSGAINSVLPIQIVHRTTQSTTHNEALGRWRFDPKQNHQRLSAPARDHTVTVALAKNGWSPAANAADEGFQLSYIDEAQHCDIATNMKLHPLRFGFTSFCRCFPGQGVYSQICNCFTKQHAARGHGSACHVPTWRNGVPDLRSFNLGRLGSISWSANQGPLEMEGQMCYVKLPWLHEPQQCSLISSDCILNNCKSERLQLGGAQLGKLAPWKTIHLDSYTEYIWVYLIQPATQKLLLKKESRVTLRLKYAKHLQCSTDLTAEWPFTTSPRTCLAKKSLKDLASGSSKPLEDMFQI